MDERDSLELGWSEETVTEVCTHQGHPRVLVVPFSRQQEGKALGADYLWWWLDQTSGVCFGMLVQAKRVRRKGDRWEVDLYYKHGKQLGDLLATAEQLAVPAMYAVYTGGRVLRAGLRCSHGGQPDCLGCRRMAISMISAYQLSAVWARTDTFSLVQTESIPLEDLVDPTTPAPPVPDVNLDAIADGPLRDFLLQSQEGPREVAKRIFAVVADHRRGAFSAASAELVEVSGDPLFADVPEDRGHFPGPYYRHVLQGLRTSPPDYVRELQLQIAIKKLVGGETRDLFPDSVLDNAVSYPAAPTARRPQALEGIDIGGVVLVTL